MPGIGVLLAFVMTALHASALAWSYGTDSNTWSADMRQQVTDAMNAAVALYNANGFFPCRLRFC